PTNGLFTISGNFTGADSRGVDTLVYVVTNGVTAFSGHVQGYQAVVPFTNIVVSLTNGAYIDFVVVWGGGVFSEYNWTGLGAVVAQTCLPPPSGLIASWRAESNALDSVGTNNGALQNGATFAAGRVGQAVSS